VREGELRLEPPALRHSEAVKFPVGGRVFESELTACSRKLQRKGRNGSGTFITDNSLAFDVNLTPFYWPSSARAVLSSWLNFGCYQ